MIRATGTFTDRNDDSRIRPGLPIAAPHQPYTVLSSTETHQHNRAFSPLFSCIPCIWVDDHRQTRSFGRGNPSLCYTLCIWLHRKPFLPNHPSFQSAPFHSHIIKPTFLIKKSTGRHLLALQPPRNRQTAFAFADLALPTSKSP